MGTLGTVTHRARWRRLKPTHALRLVPLLFGPELALPAGLSGQEECPDPVPVEVGPPGGVFQWSATPGLEGLARALGTYGAAFAPFPGIGELDPAPGLRVILLRDLDCLTALDLGTSQPDWVAGLASADRGFVAIRARGSRDRTSSLRSVLRHELAHVALERATNGAAPRWLHEGFAQLSSGTWDWQEAWRLRWGFVRGGGERLRRLSLSFPRDPDGARLAYLLSYTAVQEIVSISGEPGLRAFLRELASGASTDGAFRSVFGITESQFEDRWEQTVRSRYGLLYTLSRAAVFWFLVSVLVVWVAVRRKRRDRARMAAMRAAEAEEGAGEAEWRAVSPWPRPRRSAPGDRGTSPRPPER
jgi:hypothetical protein